MPENRPSLGASYLIEARIRRFFSCDMVFWPLQFNYSVVTAKCVLSCFTICYQCWRPVCQHYRECSQVDSHTDRHLCSIWSLSKPRQSKNCLLIFYCSHCLYVLYKYVLPRYRTGKCLPSSAECTLAESSCDYLGDWPARCVSGEGNCCFFLLLFAATAAFVAFLILWPVTIQCHSYLHS